VVSQAVCVPQQAAEGLQVYLARDVCQPFSCPHIMDFEILLHRRTGDEAPGGDSSQNHHAHQQDLPLLFQENRPLSGSIIKGPSWDCQGGTQIFPRLFLTYVQNRI